MREDERAGGGAGVNWAGQAGDEGFVERVLLE
jgi:hypothetical protein